MIVATYNALLERIRACRTVRELDTFAEELRSSFAGDPQLGDVLNSVRMARSAHAIATRQRAFAQVDAPAAW